MKFKELREKVERKSISDGRYERRYSVLNADDEIIARCRSGDIEMEVMNNGYVRCAYEDKHVTFHVDEIKYVRYRFLDGSSETISLDELDDMEWKIPVLIMAEMKIEKVEASNNRKRIVTVKEDILSFLSVPDNNTPSPEEKALSMELAEKCREEIILNSTKLMKYDIALLHFEYGFTVKELADANFVSYKTVWAYITKIRKILEKYQDVA